MKPFTVEQLSRRLPIVRDDIWVVYDGTVPVFQGTHAECRDWLDHQENLELQSRDGRSWWRSLFRRF